VSTYPPPPLAPSNGTTTVRRQEDDRRSAAERDIAAPGLRDGSAASAGGTSAELEAPTSALSASTDAPAGQHSSVSLDGFLELVHLEHLSPLDLRVLLRVTDREATVSELAASMGQPPTVLRRASAPRRARSGSAPPATIQARPSRDHARDNRVRDGCAVARVASAGDRSRRRCDLARDTRLARRRVERNRSHNRATCRRRTAAD
jgi:hypothetical protein